MRLKIIFCPQAGLGLRQSKRKFEKATEDVEVKLLEQLFEVKRLKELWMR